MFIVCHHACLVSHSDWLYHFFFFHERKKLRVLVGKCCLLPFNHLEWECRASLWLENEVNICFFGQEAFIRNYWKSCRVNVMNWCVSLGFYCISVRCSWLKQYQPFTVMRLLLALLRADKPIFFFFLYANVCHWYWFRSQGKCTLQKRLIGRGIF